MKRKLLIFIFSLYLLSSVFCALEEDSRITTSVNTEEHPVFTSIRQHLFPLVKYLYEAATLDNDHGDISKHELVRLVLQNVMHSKILLGHTLLSSSFYKKVFPTVATSYGEHRKNVKNLETQYNYKEISQFHEDFSLLVSRYTMAMSFIELTERAMTDFSVVIVQNEIFCQALTTSVLFLKTFFTSGHQHPNVRISFSFERNRSVVAVKDGYFAFMFEAEFLEYIEIYKAYLAINNILKKFPTLFPFQGLVEPLVVPLEEFPSIPNCTENNFYSSILFKLAFYYFR